jgi:hypothetical protein
LRRKRPLHYTAALTGNAASPGGNFAGLCD